ncbi:hypothetical protein B0H14DRAFT_3143122 [Mycena olivaceomarginata]|nr:hypothetical protein B0H14DRAFT_3143122 [Mycena olivaceomarginata]
MSLATPFLGATSLDDDDDFSGANYEGTDAEMDEGGERALRWVSTRILSHREAENLAPPGSPVRLPAPRTSADLATRGVLHEASAACDKIMRLAYSLERRTNAQRRLSRKQQPRLQPVLGSRVADASTAPAAGDDRLCRASTTRSPQPSSLNSLHLVSVLADAAPSHSPNDPLPLPTAAPSCTYVDTGTDAPSVPSSRDVGVDAPPLSRLFFDVAVGNDDHNTTYGVITDRFARDLARLLPLNSGRERALAQTIGYVASPPPLPQHAIHALSSDRAPCYADLHPTWICASVQFVRTLVVCMERYVYSLRPP